MAVKNTFELPEDRLASTDETGRRVYMHPAEVNGPWRNRRTAIYSVLLVVFLVLPWLEVAGHQAVLLDLPRRRFAIFGLTFWAHDAPMLVFVLLALVLGLLFVTSLWGRIWCGWGCPQTVFIDMVYRRIEGWIEGNAHERRKLDAAPLSLRKVGLRAAKWAAFTAVTLVITHSFLAYFVGTDRLAEMIRSSPAENPGTFVFMLAATGLILFDFGWFREQFCIVACPYGRLQSVLMDDRSLGVVYDEKRGEPRKARDVPPEQQGDCVSCYRCVQVCPTGVDIRRGLQMECVACTACIDACDDIMGKLSKPKGLIRYDSIVGEEQGKRRWSARSMVYAALLVVVLGGFSYTVMNRKPYNVSVVRPSSAYTLTQGGEVVNHFRLHVANHTFADADLRFELDGAGSEFNVVTARVPFPVVAGQSAQADIFIRFPAGAVPGGKREVELLVVDGRNETVRQPIRLLGPER